MAGKTLYIQDIKEKKNLKIVKYIKNIFKSTLALIIVIFALIAGLFGGAVYAYLKTAEPVSYAHLNIEDRGLTSIIYDSSGNELTKLTGSDNQNRELVNSSDIPLHLQHALIAIEDERFYDHDGIDFQRTATATISYLTGMGDKHGGSTITQQLVKNITGKFEETPQRKLQEQWTSIQLEKQLTKQQIVTSYLNIIYMGNSCYGVQSASKTYFGKNVWELTIAESALLAGITNEPAKYNLFSEKGRENARERQEIILNKMHELGFIDDIEYDEAINQELVYADPDSYNQAIKVNSYFVDQVINDVIADLAEKYGISKQSAELSLYNDGYKIYTTQDAEIQSIMDEEFTNPVHFTTDNKDAKKYNETPQAAMVIIDPNNGHVLAMYGGEGEKSGSRIFNRATQLKRHPGSSMKPISVYGPALDLKLITPATIIDDSPVRMLSAFDLAQGYDDLIEDEDVELYPQNFEKTYSGLTSVRDGLVTSKNVVAAKIFVDYLTGKNSIEYLKKVGIDREDEQYVSLALGGLQNGLSPYHMAAAYVPIVNKGVYIKPTTYTQVLDEKGLVLLERKLEYDFALNEDTSYLLTNMMKGVTEPGGTAYYGIGGRFNVDGGTIPIAGKTGTSSFNLDKWFVGFTPYYVAATWYGYDNTIRPISLSPGEERMKAQRIWKAVMERTHNIKSLDPKEFEFPTYMFDKRTIDIYSGKIATELSYQDPRGNNVRDEYFLKGTAPAYDDFDDVHVLVKLCTASTDIFGRHHLAGPNCPEDETVERVMIKRPVPYYPQFPGDPYPLDWKYEYPEGEYCIVHSDYNQYTYDIYKILVNIDSKLSPDVLEKINKLKEEEEKRLEEEEFQKDLNKLQKDKLFNQLSQLLDDDVIIDQELEKEMNKALEQALDKALAQTSQQTLDQILNNVLDQAHVKIAKYLKEREIREALEREALEQEALEQEEQSQTSDQVIDSASDLLQ